MNNLTIKTKLNIFTLTFFFFGLIYIALNYAYFTKTTQSIVDMTSNELLIKNTTNAISQDFFLMNTIVFSHKYEEEKKKIKQLDENIDTNIAVIKQYANKNNQELLQYITNIEIRYKSYFAMIQTIEESSNDPLMVETKKDMYEGLSQILIKTNGELEQLNDFSNRLFRDSIYKIITNLEEIFLCIVGLFSISLLFLVGLNFFIKKSILNSISELQKVIDYFMILLSDKSSGKKPTFAINHHNEIAQITKDIARNLPFIEDNISKLKQLGLRDELTGLFNRRYLSEIGEGLLKFAKRQEQLIAVLVLDIDYFKSTNDTFGHDAGDSVLKDFSNILLWSVREADIVIRYGGEEFVVILQNIKESKNALVVADQIRENVKRFDFIVNNNITIKKSVSIGIAIFPESGSSIAELISSADAVLYKAKNNGRDRVEVAKKFKQIGESR